MRHGAVVSFLLACAWLGAVSSAPLRAQQSIARIEPVNLRDCAAPCPRLAVIFVHGITGDRETWTNADSRANWPELLAGDPDIGDKLDVYRADYDSFYLENSPSVTAIAKVLNLELERLIKQRDYKRVAIVGHSLGGIIGYNFLMHMKTGNGGHGDMARVRLMLTYGAPLRGGSYASLVSRFGRNEQLRVLVEFKINDFMQSLSDNLERSFAKRDSRDCPALNTWAAFEQLPVVRFTSRIVEEASATAFATHRGDATRGFDLDHIELVKPANREASVYTWTKDALSRCLAGNGLCMGEITSVCR